MPTNTDLENKYDNGAGQAAHLLKYYLRLIACRAGVNWDSDNDAEEVILGTQALRFPTGEHLLDWVAATKSELRPGEVKQ